MVRGKFVRNEFPAMQLSHSFSRSSVCFMILAQYSMNPYVYSTGFGRCTFRCSAGPCRCRTGFGTTYGQSCRPVWGKYRACRTHKYGRHLDHGSKIDGSPSLKAQHAHLSPTGYTSPYGSNNHRKIVQTRSDIIRPV